MALNNLKTLTTSTAIVASVKLTATAADRLGLGFAAQAYPLDNLSPNPASEQDRSRQEQSAEQMRKQLHEGVPAVPPVPKTVGCLPPGTRAVVSWPTAAKPSRIHWATVSVGRTRISRDCQSPARVCDKQSLLRQVAPAATAGK
ncbi:hypothetical protein R5W24_000323 [Gemmata sp. JC717]|uniref:Uncharacterized protein n=1 Tax=Gemmata algarum TaxID=2975278 RepID=A0ABU5F6E9_9BACT|nr:hypothetical protein [Gemmata algarum]MDY3551248.1 hypothetical protein [Gemmata algarum]MDY3563122.1 hypothetical protein [Gemmata algarum]